MKRFAKVAAVVVFFILLIVGSALWPMIQLMWHMSTQMKAGQKYMNSLTAADIPAWTARTEELLAKYGPKESDTGKYSFDGKAVPADLQKLKVIRVDVYDANTVSYIWLASMDRTELLLQRQADGSYEFTARYDDEDSRVIWPKR